VTIPYASGRERAARDYSASASQGRLSYQQPVKSYPGLLRGPLLAPLASVRAHAELLPSPTGTAW